MNHIPQVLIPTWILPLSFLPCRVSHRCLLRSAPQRKASFATFSPVIPIAIGLVNYKPTHSAARPSNASNLVASSLFLFHVTSWFRLAYCHRQTFQRSTVSYVKASLPPQVTPRHRQAQNRLRPNILLCLPWVSHQPAAGQCMSAPGEVRELHGLRRTFMRELPTRRASSHILPWVSYRA